LINPQKGTLGITFIPQHKDWSTDDHTYLLGEVLREGLSLRAIKHTDRTLELTLDGPLGKTLTLRGPQPPCRKLRLGFAWEDAEMQFFMNGKRLQTFNLSHLQDDEEGKFSLTERADEGQ
jgi:hypothetical protein